MSPETKISFLLLLLLLAGGASLSLAQSQGATPAEVQPISYFKLAPDVNGFVSVAADAKGNEQRTMNRSTETIAMTVLSIGVHGPQALANSQPSSRSTSKTQSSIGGDISVPPKFATIRSVTPAVGARAFQCGPAMADRAHTSLRSRPLGFEGRGQANVRVPSGIAPGPAVPVRLDYLIWSSNQLTMGVR